MFLYNFPCRIFCSVPERCKHQFRIQDQYVFMPLHTRILRTCNQPTSTTVCILCHVVCITAVLVGLLKWKIRVLLAHNVLQHKSRNALFHTASKSWHIIAANRTSISRCLQKYIWIIYTQNDLVRFANCGCHIFICFMCWLVRNLSNEWFLVADENVAFESTWQHNQ